MMTHSPIIPAVIPQSAAMLLEALELLQGVPEIHVDVVDGDFVPAVSWPHEPTGNPAKYKKHFDRFSLEVDLMVRSPLTASIGWLAAGADRLVFHCETLSTTDFQSIAEATNISIGISAHMDTPNEILFPYLAYADYVQVMGIAQIGSQGQPFDNRALDRIAWLKSVAPMLPISIDGSVNSATLATLIPHALERYIVGSAIIKQPDPEAAYRTLTALWQSTAK